MQGMEWLGEIEEEDIPPDDDFFERDAHGQRKDKAMRGRLFLVLFNQQALSELLSMWNRWKSGGRFDHGLGKWQSLFAQLRDVRPWGIKDRLLETGVLDDWQERIEHDEEVVPCEIELWFRKDHHMRNLSVQRITILVEELGGQVIGQAVVDQIAYHALLARLPIAAITLLIDEAGLNTALVQCEQIQFVRASGQMVGNLAEDARETEEYMSKPLEKDLLPPVVALFDGLPLQNHMRLGGYLIIDDPDSFEADYAARDRRHGTAMASLIVHGDLTAEVAPIHRSIYVRPILKPNPQDWNSRRQEIVPENMLVVDLMHRAVQRMLRGEGTEPPSAPHVCVVNLSIGIRDRVFQYAMRPLARLLDWLAWEHKLLFVVSAGNHLHPIRIDVPRDKVANLLQAELQSHVVQAIAADARHRRLLSPAEALNALTVGATHHDYSDHIGIPGALDPYGIECMPSPVNAQGMGYRRSIKPEVLMPGGRVVLRERLIQAEPDQATEFDIYTQTQPPGQRVAAPGPNPGDLSYVWHTRGTSNATALAGRAVHALYEVLEELRDEPGGQLIDQIPRALWLKALLTHTARWGKGGEIFTELLRTRDNSRQFKEYLTRLVGYGAVDPMLAGECTAARVTALGGGELRADQSYIHRFPLPPSLSGKSGLRRLVITLAWFTPINAAHQGWRRADLWFSPPAELLKVGRQEADWRAVQRGTLQHEVLEGKSAAAFADGDELEIQVSCREDAGVLEDAIPYALAVTLEVAEEIEIDVYQEVRQRVLAARVAIAAEG